MRTPAEAALDEGAIRHLRNRADVRFSVIREPAQLSDVYRLRARTAAARWNIAESSFPHGEDCDEDDEHAIHIGGWRNGNLVTAARLIPAEGHRLLPIEKHFDVTVTHRSHVVEVGRLVVSSEIVDRRSTGLLALLGFCWQHADDRRFWAGPNSDSVIRLYQLLGATCVRLGEAQSFMGERRTPVMWDMHAFSHAFLALALRHQAHE